MVAHLMEGTREWEAARLRDAFTTWLHLRPAVSSVKTRQLLDFGESETISIDECTVVGRFNPFAEKLCGSSKFRAAQFQELLLPDHRWWGCDREPPVVFGGLHLLGI